jgi:hypothetical protein
MGRVFLQFLRLKGFCSDVLHSCFVRWTKPLSTSLLYGAITGLNRSKSEFMAENAFLRQQLSILHRQIKRPVCTKADQIFLVLLARLV